MLRVFVAVFLLFAVAAAARAENLTCGPAEPGTVSIDGLLDDWHGVSRASVAGDPGVSIACNTEGKTLLFVIDVTDARFVRSAKNAPGEDHLELVVGGKRLVIYPGDANKIKERVTLGGAPLPKSVKIASSLQKNGWAVEIALPLAALGIRSLAAALPYKLVVSDCDSAASAKTEATATLEGDLAFADAAASVKAFLDDRRLKEGDIWFDKPIRLGAKKEGRALLAGRYLAVITDEYAYIELPAERRDIKDVLLVDLGGDGREAIALRLVEHGKSPTASRELIVVYRMGAQFQKVFAIEVARAFDKQKLENKAQWVRRGKATDLAIEVGAAQGYTADNFGEWGGDDVVPIAVPWGTEKKQRYQFVGDEYRRSQ